MQCALNRIEFSEYRVGECCNIEGDFIAESETKRKRCIIAVFMFFFYKALNPSLRQMKIPERHVWCTISCVSASKLFKVLFYCGTNDIQLIPLCHSISRWKFSSAVICSIGVSGLALVPAALTPPRSDIRTHANSAPSTVSFSAIKPDFDHYCPMVTLVPNNAIFVFFFKKHRHLLQSKEDNREFHWDPVS